MLHPSGPNTVGLEECEANQESPALKCDLTASVSLAQMGEKQTVL